MLSCLAWSHSWPRRQCVQIEGGRLPTELDGEDFEREQRRSVTGFELALSDAVVVAQNAIT
jgi:hypothetical protein